MELESEFLVMRFDLLLGGRLRQPEDVVGVPYFGGCVLGGDDQIKHAGHDGPADEGCDGTLHLALLALVRLGLRLDEVAMLGLVGGAYSRREGFEVFGGREQAVREGQGHDGREGENEEGVELTLLVVRVV